MTTGEALSLPVDLSAGKGEGWPLFAMTPKVATICGALYDRFKFNAAGVRRVRTRISAREIGRGVLNPESHARPGALVARGQRRPSRRKGEPFFDLGARTSQSSLCAGSNTCSIHPRSRGTARTAFRGYVRKLARHSRRGTTVSQYGALGSSRAREAGGAAGSVSRIWTTSGTSSPIRASCRAGARHDSGLLPRAYRRRSLTGEAELRTRRLSPRLASCSTESPALMQPDVTRAGGR
jgi:hypothetical protein